MDGLIDDTQPAKSGVVTPLKTDFTPNELAVVERKPSVLREVDQQARVQRMVGLPAPVALAPADAAEFRRLVQKKQALQTWVQMVTEQAEQRVQAIVADEQKLVLAVAKANNLDIDKVLWSFNAQNNSFVPTQMRLV